MEKINKNIIKWVVQVGAGGVGGAAANRGAYVLIKTHDFPSVLASS
jgi:hypothetical protein